MTAALHDHVLFSQEGMDEIWSLIVGAVFWNYLSVVFSWIAVLNSNTTSGKPLM